MQNTWSMLEPKRRALTVAAWALLIFAPVVLIAAISLVIGRNAFNGYPVWSDEVDYWRSIFTWLHASGTPGYSGVGELAPLMGTLSVHGVTPLLLYGGLARIFGWTFSSITAFNCVWVGAGALTFVALLRPKASVAAWMALMMMLYAPVVLYCTTSMTELANYGLLLFYLAFLGKLWQTRRNASPIGETLDAPVFSGWLMMLLGGLTVTLMCAYRITYLGLFLPLVFVALDGRWSGKMFLALLFVMILTLFIYYLTALYTSPFSSGFLYNFLRAGSLRMAAKMFLSHAKSNLMDYFLRAPANPMETYQRYLYGGMSLLFLLGSFVKVEFSKKHFHFHFGLDKLSIGAFLTLFLPFAVVVCAYETTDWSDYRALAPFLWLTAAVFLLRGRKLLPGVFLLSSAVILGLMLLGEPVGAYRDEYRFTQPPFSAEAQELCQAVQYDPSADDPYANTVRTDYYTLESVASLDPGIGIETGWFTQDTVGKSRWVLTDHLRIPLEGYELVLKNKSGSVYRLIDSEK